MSYEIGMTTAPTSFLPLDVVASRLGLPCKWIRDQADTGTIPCLKVNGRRLFDLESVRDALVERARGAKPEAEGQ